MGCDERLQLSCWSQSTPKTVEGIWLTKSAWFCLMRYSLSRKKHASWTHVSKFQTLGDSKGPNTGICDGLETLAHRDWYISSLCSKSGKENSNGLAETTRFERLQTEENAMKLHSYTVVPQFCELTCFIAWFTGANLLHWSGSRWVYGDKITIVRWPVTTKPT